jgi:putative transferase (TIGR04331 family)
MFLVTTANQNFWKTDEKILFLGEWCKIYDQKHIWSKIDHETFPSNWDKWEDFDQRYKYLESVCEKYLNSFVLSLNDSHDENHSLRYWRIVLGPWLNFFVGNIYDKYLSIKSAIESKKVTQTWIPSLKPRQWLPSDTITFLLRAAGNNNFNLYLYGRVINKLRQIPFEHKEDKSFSELLGGSGSLPLPSPAKGKGIIRKLLEEFSKRTSGRFNQVVFSSSGFSLQDQWKLHLSLGQIPFSILPQITSCQLPINESLRKNIKPPQETNEFESILNDLIIEQLPTSFLEGYSTMRNKSLDAFPKRPKVIFTSNDFAFNEGFKLWAATKVEQGVKLILSQHGGGYGFQGPLVTENHELKVCDKYFTWGWTKNEEPKVLPLSSLKLSSTNHNEKFKLKGTILWVSETLPLFFIRIDHVVTGLIGSKYFLRQASFLNVICPEVSKILLLRFPSRKCEWNGEKRLVDNYPSIKWYKGEDSILSQLQKSKLCIHDYLGTTWLETLSINFPTVVFCDLSSVKIIASAQPYLDDLRRVRILHDSPESAAEFINKIHEDPMSWWVTSELQQVRKKFCNQFARKSENYLEEWREELLKMVKKS